MAKSKEIKEIVRNYILENYKNERIEDPAGEDVEAIKDISPEVLEARKALFNINDEDFLQALRQIGTVGQAGQLLVQVLDFINKVTPAPSLNRDLATQFIQSAEDRNFDLEKLRGEEEPEAEEEDTVDEMSTTAGAPAPATKYAFRRKKK